MRVGLETLPDEYRRNVIIWVCAVVAGAALFALLGKRFDWQRLDPVLTCRHCLRVHGIAGIVSSLCDAIMLSALFILGIEPLLAALRAELYAPLDLAIVMVVMTAELFMLTAIGFAVRAPIGSRTGFKRGDVVSNLVAGGRLSAFFVSTWMFSQGLGRASIAGRLMQTFGARLGSRIYFAVGPAAIRDTLVVLLAGCALSGLVRWLAPLLAGSKPLVFMAQPAKAVAA